MKMFSKLDSLLVCLFAIALCGCQSIKYSEQNSLSNGSELGVLSFSLGTSFEFPISENNKTHDVVIDVALTGESVSVLTFEPSHPFKFKGEKYPGTGGTCSSKITANCTIVISFTPQSEGIYTSDLKFTYVSGMYKLTSYLNLKGQAKDQLANLSK